MVTDQFWLSWVEMVMNEVAVDLVGDREISTNLGEVLGGDGFSQLGFQANRVFWVFGHHCVGSPPTAKFNYIFTGRL